MNTYKFNNTHYWLSTEDLSYVHPFFNTKFGEIEAGQTISTIVDLCKLVEDKKILLFESYDEFCDNLIKYDLYDK
jgi:hypothetical protein